MEEKAITKILPNVKEFKQFWKDHGPFKYALTSSEYPPILLEPEQWLFSNDIRSLLKELMQFDKNKMKFVRADFNPDNKKVLRPEGLSPWKINNFPNEWNALSCKTFVPVGYLTVEVTGGRDIKDKDIIETAFFESLEVNIGDLGYTLLKPAKGSKSAAIQAYVKEWEEDEKDAGIL